MESFLALITAFSLLELFSQEIFDYLSREHLSKRLRIVSMDR